MIWHIVQGRVFTLFLSLGHITAVTFPGKVEDYAGGRRLDLKIHQLDGGKTLVFEPLRKSVDRNFIAFVKGKKYHFNLKIRPALSHKDITLAQGRPCSELRSIKDTPRWQLFECPRSLYFVNKTPSPIRLNELTVTDKAFISKGPPVLLDGKIIHHHGRAL